jgi:hypothetical protein
MTGSTVHGSLGWGRIMKKKQFDIREYETFSKILKSIADKYPKTSPESKAIELAAKALVFACEYTVYQEFEIFLREWDKKLSPKEKEHLKKMKLIKVDADGKMHSKLKFRKN